MNTIHSKSILHNSAAASWLPICLPKFNSSAFVNAYVTFLRRNNEPTPTSPPLPSSSSPSEEPGSSEGASSELTVRVESEVGKVSNPETYSGPPLEIGLVCVSGAADFESVRGWCSTVIEVSCVLLALLVTNNWLLKTLEKDGMMDSMVEAIQQKQIVYSVSDLSIPGLRHFLYKSRQNVQISMPEFEEPYDDLNERRRYAINLLVLK